MPRGNAASNGRRPQAPPGRGQPPPSGARRPRQAPALPDVRLRILDGPGAGTEFALAASVVRLGRGEDNDIVLEDNNASRVHAEIVVSKGKCVVRDLGSRNGIYVNRKKVPQATLADGDRITIGGTSVEFINEAAPRGMGAAPGAGGASADGGGLKRALAIGGAVGVILIVLIAMAGGKHGPAVDDGSGGGTGSSDGGGLTNGNGDLSLNSLLAGGNGKPGGVGVGRNDPTKATGIPPLGTPPKVDEKRVQDMVNQGDFAMSSAKLADARAFYAKATQLDPSCERCATKLRNVDAEIKNEIDSSLHAGIEYFNTARYDDAKRMFEKVELLDPDPKSLNNGNAASYIKQIDAKLADQGR